MNLFQKVDFISHSGKTLDWKLECDALTDKDWECIAYLISKKYKFGSAVGIPSGGTKLAEALGKYTSESSRFLIVDDVLTTGRSMKEYAEMYNDSSRVLQGIVLFARGKCPDWITPIFTLNSEMEITE